VRTNLSTAQRLLLGFGVVVLLLAALGVASWVGLHRLGALSQETYEDRVVPMKDLATIARLQMRNRILVMDAIDKPTLENIGKRMTELDGNVATIDATWQRYMATRLTVEERALADKFMQARAAYFTRGVQPAAAALKANQVEEAARLYRSQISPLAPAATESIDALLSLQVRVAEESNAEGGRLIDSLSWLIGGLSAGAVLLATLIALLITRSLVRQLGAEPADLAAVARRIADGDLSLVATRDAVPGSVMASMQAMQAALTRVVSDVRAGVASVATASSQIAAGNQDLSSRTEEQASSLQQTAASMEQMTSSVRTNAESAREADALARGASQVAERGGSAVGEVVATMTDIQAASRRIEEIIAVIDGIAFQTNILALNAAVEAARAGEQGRGFAVVAGEVRNLAQRSAQAAKEIKTLIGDSVARIHDGSARVQSAGQTIGEVVAQVQRVSRLIGEISAATLEQSGGITQVNEAVTQLDQVTQQNAALVEESAAAAASLREQAERLAQAVSVFKLAEGQTQQVIARARGESPRRAAPAGATAAAVRAAPAVPRAAAGAAPARTAVATAAGASDDWQEF
jgi:methyl-accepting chemotaxis protein-1 (serine sensor receptor)